MVNHPDLSQGLECSPIPWTCSCLCVDACSCLTDFQYITRSSFPKQYSNLPSLPGCTCTHLDCCSINQDTASSSFVLDSVVPGCGCHIRRQSSRYEWDSHKNQKRLSSAPSSFGIVECNAECTCSPLDCLFRLVQLYPSVNTELSFQLKVHPQKGYGVILDGASRGQYIGEYCGTYIRSSEMDDVMSGSKHYYVLQLREEMNENTILRTTVDASSSGNVTRFFNHSCSPNLTVESVRIESIVPHLAFFARHDIEPGEELTFDYGAQVLEATMDDRVSTTRCYCGSNNCRSFLPAH